MSGRARSSSPLAASPSLRRPRALAWASDGSRTPCDAPAAWPATMRAPAAPATGAARGPRGAGAVRANRRLACQHRVADVGDGAPAGA